MSKSELDDMDLQALAVSLVLGVMRSASTEKIRPMDWWIRAQSALKSAASMAGSFGQLTSIMGRKLQIPTFNGISSRLISSIGEQVADPDDFESFRCLCERDALYIVAEAQARRQIERELKENHDDTEIRQAGL
jgi:hypothetical protein